MQRPGSRIGRREKTATGRTGRMGSVSTGMKHNELYGYQALLPVENQNSS